MVKSYFTNDGLPVTHIWTIYKDKQGGLLFGMADDSVYVFNGAAFKRRF